MLVGYRDGPGLAHVSQGERQILITKTREGRDEVVAGVTSLAPEHADAGRLLALVPGRWPIAHQAHWVREVTCDEDRSPVRCGSMPQVMAAVRHTIIGLLRWAGHTSCLAIGSLPARRPATCPPVNTAMTSSSHPMAPALRARRATRANPR